MQRKTRPVYSNCVYQALFALLSGRIPTLLMVKSASPLWPVHLVVRLKRGRLIHYQTMNKKNDTFAPFWFLGQWRECRSSEVERRGVIFTCNGFFKYFWIILLFLMGFPILFVLWLFFQPVYAVKNIAKSLKTRWSRRL